MPVGQVQLVALLAVCLWAASVEPRGDGRQPVLLGGEDGTLVFEAAPEQNITFRLMGEAATLLLNDEDVVSLLRRRKRALTLAARRGPISLDTLRYQFRTVQGDLTRLGQRLASMYNGTRRYGQTQRAIRRGMQRSYIIGNTLTTLETNLAEDNCRSNPCQNGGTCYDAYNEFHCVCAAGWQGAVCTDDVDECTSYAGTDLAVCQNDGQCINTPGSYRCTCRTGYSGAHCRLREHACLGDRSAELCGSQGTCVPSSSRAGYVCICNAGWTWADTNVSVASASPCTRDVDECAPEKNPCHDKCINLPGSFKCAACPPGYTGDGRHCRDIDECGDGNNGGCSQQPLVNCINTEGSYRCGRCPAGWTGNGRVCTEANTCSELICDPRAKCEYISDTVVCTCPVGFYGHGYGANGCTEDSSRQPCDDHRCNNNGTCVLNGRGTSCICQPGYTGPLCDKADACHPNPCQNGGTCRLLPENQHTCICLPGFTGIGCSHVRSYCGIVLRNMTGSLEYPPRDTPSAASAGYQPNERCAFIIRTRPGYVLNMTFGMFDLQPSSECVADFLQLHDGSSLTARQIGRYCGNQLPQGNGSIVSTQEQLFFWFRSDNATQAAGFNLTWHSQPIVCGESLELALGASGVLRSPNYPGKARFGLDCRWLLAAPFGSRFVLRFFDITLGSSTQNCSTGDSLAVWDSDRLLYKACQSAQPAPVHSSSNQLRLQFHTDAYRLDSSFQLHYEVVPGHPGCGGVFTEPTGLIIGHAGAELCLYLIEQPNGTQIELTPLNLSKNVWKHCSTFKLEIFDGRNDQSPLLRHYCATWDDYEDDDDDGIERNAQPLTSSGNVILVRYYNGLAGISALPSFELRYKRVCNFSYHNAIGGVIMTPNYPNGYFEQLECTYRLEGPFGHTALLTLTDLSLSVSENEAEDQSSYLDVYLFRNESGRQRFSKQVHDLLLVSESNQARLVFHGGVNPSRGRGMRLEYTFVDDKCSGVMTRPQSEPLVLLKHGYCQWVIESPGLKHLRMTVEPAMGVQVNLFENSTRTEGRLLKSYTKSLSEIVDIDEYLDWDVITVTAQSMQQYKVMLKYRTVETACGETFTTRYGQIKSPNWPQKYPASVDCSWIIRTQPGRRIELVVRNFSVETTWSDCRDDYLEIRNGDQPTSPLIGRYCGERIPARIPSFGNALYLHFRSDPIEWSGFYITWQEGAYGCGGKLNSPTGSIHSPHDLAGHREALFCDWQISVAQGSTIRMNLTSSSSSSSSSDLCNGQLSIYDGPNVLANPLAFNCSNVGQSMALNATGNQVLVRLEIGPTDIDFVLEYATNCRVRLDKLRGAIETPNFPDKYPANMNCEWEIWAGSRRHHIQLAFSHMDVESSPDGDCPFDHVLIADYRYNELISERRLCNARNLKLSSVGNRLVVHFSSDESNQAQGFRAEYQRTGCGGELQGPGGTLETPNAPYSLDEECEWLITVPAGYQIRLLFHELHIETPQPDCSEDGVKVVSGNNESRPIFASCRIETNTQTIVSPANEIIVRFQGSPRRARKYFRASYAMLPASCGGYVSGSKGSITSPGYYEKAREVYDKDVECTWDLEVAEGYVVLVYFEVFNFTDSPNCSRAHFKLLESNESFCGQSAPARRLLEHRFRFGLRATAGSWGRFVLNYKQLCGGPRTSSDGYIRSNVDEDCVWTISVEQGTQISLNIYQLDCPRCPAAQANCTTGLSIVNKDDLVESVHLCDDHPASLVLTTNRAIIKATGIALSAQYTTIENSCGGNISSVRGILTSPRYPASYPANIECVWTLLPRAGNAVELRFEALDIVKSEHCNSDFLELRAGIQGALIGLYCGDQLPAEPLLTRGQPMWIKFRSQPGNTASGFKLRWSYVHSNELTEGSNGTIESPPTLAVRGDDQPYSWRIFTERQRVIILDFVDYQAGLLLYDGYDDTALAVAIGAAPWQFTSSSNVIYLRTVNTDFDEFRVQWRVQRLDELKSNEKLKTGSCHKIQLVQNTLIPLNSPGYPGYKPNLNCEWTFMPFDLSKHAYVDIYEVRLEATSRCTADYLSVQVSSNAIDWPEQLRLCNSSAYNGRRIGRVHGTPYLRLQFVTDASVNGTGFRTNIRTECGSNMTGSVGTILNSHTQRQLPIENPACEWHIEVQPGKMIELTIDYKKVERNGSCQHYGFIYDGVDTSAPIVAPGKFCGQTGFATRTFRTSGRHAFIRYVYPGANFRTNPVLNGWNLTYRAVSECDAEVQLNDLASSYVISTPGYPYYPHPHSDCSWLAIAPPGETIAASFMDNFDLSQRNCDKEFVELYDGSTRLARRLLRTCRRTATIYSSGNILLVHYLTQLNEPHTGFRLNVSISSCGGHYNAQSGIISSVHYPTLGAYPKPAVCEYVIQTPANTHIQLNFSDLHLPLGGPDNDRIELLDLNDQRRTIMTVYGNLSVPHPITVSTNQLAVRLTTVILKNNYRGFQLSYKTKLGTCNREVNAASGELELKKPRNENDYQYCSWRITVPKGQRVRFELLNLQDFRNETQLMSRRRSGTSKTFSFYNDPTYQSKIVEFSPREYTGDGIVESTDNFMLVRILLAYQPAALRARFSSTSASLCPADIGGQESGIISNQELIELSTYYCAVHFVADPGVTISFNVEYYRSVGQHLQTTFRIWDDVLHTSIIVKSDNVTHSLATTAGKLMLTKQPEDSVVRLRVSYHRNACGGVLQMTEGIRIELPLHELAEHTGQLECMWTLRFSVGYRISGNVSFSDSCDREYLMVSRFGSTGDLAQICGSAVHLNSTQLDVLQVSVLYHASAFQAGRSQLQLEATRPQSLNDRRNTVLVGRTPTPPFTIDGRSYHNNMELSWEFRSTLTLALRLEFLGRFFIEMSANCSHDQLEVFAMRQGLWHSLAKYCGRERPEPLHIDSHIMRIVFRTNGNVTADGFSFVVSSSCDKKLVASHELQTLSLARGGRWTARECNVEIVTDTNEEILVAVKRALAPSRVALYCHRNFFEIIQENGDKLEPRGENCFNFEVNGYKRLRLRYVSLSSVEIRFQLQYQLISCGGNYSAPFILRPSAGSLDGANMPCEWHVLAPPEHAIFVRFKYLDIENSPLCRLKHVSIYRGKAISEEMRISRLCGNLTDYSVMVDSHLATIVSVLGSSSDWHPGSFMATVHFTPNCNERLVLGAGNTRLSLVRRYQLNATNGEDLHCYFRASAVPGYRISVWLKQLQLNPDRCTVCNSLEVIDGFESDSKSLGIYRHAAAGNDTKLFSSNHELVIALAGTVALPNGISFELVLEMEATVCGQTNYNLLANETVNLRLNTSRLDSYEGSIHCVWTFRADFAVELNMSAQLQDVSQATGKCIDYLLLTREHDSSKHFCGEFNNTVMVVPKDSPFTLTFHSSADRESDTIDIYLTKRQNCNRSYDSLSRMIHYHVEDRIDPGLCWSMIRVPQGFYLTFEIRFINLDRSSGNSFLNLTDLHTNRTIFNVTHVQSIAAVTLPTTSNEIRLIGEGVRYIDILYYSTNSDQPAGCGGELVTLEGQISSPDYNNRNYSYCTWHITVPGGSVLQFGFNWFDMGSEVNCVLDNIKFYEVLADNSEKLHNTFCGQDATEPFLVRYNEIRIVAKKSPNFNGIGFQLFYHNTIDSYSAII